MITQERADILTKILESDEQRAKNLLSLEASEALAQINALGNDFTLDELKAYGKVLNDVIATQNGELDVDQLSEVSGGVAPLIIAGGVFLGGVACGVIKSINW